MKRVSLSLAFIVLVLGIVVAGCAKPAPSSTPTSAPVPPKTLDIGIVTPLTGLTANTGVNLQNAILLAIDDQNKQGGVTIAGEKYVLNGIARDSKLDVIVGKSVAEELILDKGVKVIGGTLLGDAASVQVITEKNKLILFTEGTAPGRIGPDKPYTFGPYGGSVLAMMVSGAEYMQQFYPEPKTVITMMPALPGVRAWADTAKALCERCGFDWLGYEEFPMDTKDFMPVIARALSKQPNVIDTSVTGGAMGGLCCLLIKQLREAGFNGIVWAPTVPPPPVMMEIVPKEYLTKVITGDVLVDSPIVSQAYKDMHQRYIDKFGEPPIDIAGEMYNGVKPFFEFLNGQDSMDTTAWMEGFAKYHWQGYFGHEAFWLGKPIYGIDRVALRPFYVSEWTDGKLETKWEAPIPWDLFVEQ